MVNRKKELIKNTGILFLGKIFVQFLSFLLLPLYTSVLSTSDYGTVDLIATYVGLIAPLVTIQIEMAIFRFLVENRNNIKQRKKIITTSFLFVATIAAVCSIILVILSIFIDIGFKYYIILMILSMIFSNTLLQLARGNGDNVGYSIAGVLSAVCTIGLNIIFLAFLHTGPSGMFLSTIIANIVCSVFIFLREKAYKDIDHKSYDKNLLKELLKYSYPFVPNSIIWWIIGVSDRTIISAVIGVGINGIYSIANKFPSVFIQIYNIYYLSWSETVLLHINDKDKDTFISKGCNEALKMFFSVSILIIAALPFVFDLIVGSNYAEAYNYIPLILLGSLFNVFVGLIGPIYAAKKLSKEIAKTTLFAGIINIVVDIVLIKFIGVYAAIISTIASFVVMSIYRYFDVQKYVKIKISKKLIAFMVTIYALLTTLYYQKNIVASFILLTIAVITSIVLCRDIIKSILEFAKGLLNKKNGKK